MCVWNDEIRCRPLKITHTPHNGDADSTEDPQITKERERLIQKFGEKRLRRIIAKYQRRKREAEQRQREQWIRDQFRISSVCNKHAKHAHSSNDNDRTGLSADPHARTCAIQRNRAVPGSCSSAISATGSYRSTANSPSAPESTRRSPLPASRCVSTPAVASLTDLRTQDRGADSPNRRPARTPRGFYRESSRE